jgi:hypothetical protein
MFLFVWRTGDLALQLFDRGQVCVRLQSGFYCLHFVHSFPDLILFSFTGWTKGNSKDGWCIQVCFGRPVALLVVLAVEGIATS